MMKKLAVAALAAIAVTAFAADKKAAEPRGVAGGQVSRMVSTVEAVDQATRVVTLKDKKGNTYTFVAGPDVRNLAQVQVGDVVTMEYLEAAAIELKKTDSKVRERTETQIKQGAALGEKPAGIVGTEVKITASVEAVDTKASKVTLRGPQRTVVLKVKDPAMLKNVKVGDMVEGTFIDALAIKVEKAPAAPAKK